MVFTVHCGKDVAELERMLQSNILSTMHEVYSLLSKTTTSNSQC
jgi:hypothetical protein